MKETDEWLRTLYVEAWKQYSHEDTMSQSRNTLFLSSETVLLAVLGAISGGLVAMEPIQVLSTPFLL